VVLRRPATGQGDPALVQKMDFEGLLHFVARQKRMDREVHTCYETGAFGYWHTNTDEHKIEGVSPASPSVRK
jgi:hypothetical protein